jgi:hypothetical protein
MPDLVLEGVIEHKQPPLRLPARVCLTPVTT